MSNNHLIVGLGGTGGKVIRALRKIAKTHTDVSGVSPSEANFEFVYLDTSEGLLNETEKWTVLGHDCSLARAQMGIYAASGVRPILQDPDSYQVCVTGSSPVAYSTSLMPVQLEPLKSAS